MVLVPGSDSTLDEGAYTTIRIMGQVFDKQDRARQLIEFMDGIKNDLNTRTASIAEEDKPTVYVGGVSFKESTALMEQRQIMALCPNKSKEPGK